MATECKKCAGKKLAIKNIEKTLTKFQKEILVVLRSGVRKQTEISKKLIELGFESTPQKVLQNVKWMKHKGVVIIR